jgi:predicted nucleic acid-binding protein
MASLSEPQVIIVDSSALVALAVETDAWHTAAVHASRNLIATRGRLIIPSDVFTETMNLLGKMSGHETALRLSYEILAPSPNSFTVLEANKAIRTSALKRFAKQPGSVSFTDCVVMAFADKYDTKTIFGFDDDFRKNGDRIIEQEARPAA